MRSTAESSRLRGMLRCISYGIALFLHPTLGCGNVDETNHGTDAADAADSADEAEAACTLQSAKGSCREPFDGGEVCVELTGSDLVDAAPAKAGCELEDGSYSATRCSTAGVIGRCVFRC